MAGKHWKILLHTAAALSTPPSLVVYCSFPHLLLIDTKLSLHGLLL